MQPTTQTQLSFNFESIPALPTSLERSFEQRMISRQSLQCYVDSWIGPTDRSRRDDNPCVYVFRVPGMSSIKVGATQHPVCRRQTLRHQWRGDAPGDMIHVEPVSLLRRAFGAEKLAHRILSKHRSPIAGQIEWFDAPASLIINVVVLAVGLIESSENTLTIEEIYKIASVSSVITII